MSGAHIARLRQETIDMFFHGYDGYMRYAFPEDELRPITCTPLTRDTANPGHIELNDVLGNYSLTLVDSLSTLAILASSAEAGAGSYNALLKFQEGVAALVENYGDGTGGPRGQGTRTRGFDLDSKVQVFETVIRGVGGLLSAHLFAVGDLPIRGYYPYMGYKNGRQGIIWESGFVYDGQLLRLAHDLAQRLLPAFYTPTGLPYPRVNLRHGIPFYANSPLNYNSVDEQCEVSASGPEEITETCSAGAGSLVLEFTTLSRLTGDNRFEELGKRAFWAVWSRKSSVGLIGAGVDAESGQWIGPYTGIGAGIDSFFEYALKSHILLSGLNPPNATRSSNFPLNPNILFEPLNDAHNSPEAFLLAWQEAHDAIKRHLYRGKLYQHPHYIQGDLYTGALRAFWIDSLSAYYPGLLTLGGELEEAIETNLFYTALWTRYSALPERWSTATGSIEGGLRWWGGRPEFIESTYHLFRATQDPWYLYVGEMVLKDINRRCKTECGWAGLQDVRTGELTDRMESFFLGETAKYLFLLFSPDHPLNTLDAPYVFTTEGHPLIIPRKHATKMTKRNSAPLTEAEAAHIYSEATCPVPALPIPLSLSATTAREDFFHASSLTKLHAIPLGLPNIEVPNDHPINTQQDRSVNLNYYPWTLPQQLTPPNGTCSKIEPRQTFDITFPLAANLVMGPGTLQRINDGILINSLPGIRLGLVRENPPFEPAPIDQYRVYAVGNIALGRDEKVFVSRESLSSVVNAMDPNFSRIRDMIMLDLVFDLPLLPVQESKVDDSSTDDDLDHDNRTIIIADTLDMDGTGSSLMKAALDSLIQHISSVLVNQTISPIEDINLPPQIQRFTMPAITPVGVGAAPLPDVVDSPMDVTSGPLAWTSIYIGDETCDIKLPLSAVRNHQILVIKRGGCSFSTKLTNIPSFTPSSSSLQLVIVVSYPEHSETDIADDWLVRPLLDQQQTTPAGLPRHHAIPMVMVGGGDQTYETLKHIKGVGMRRRYEIRSRGLPVSNLVVI